MKKLYHISAFLLLLCIIVGCFYSEQEKTINTDSFFDLKQYFNNELKQLEKIKEVHKVVEINGKKEEKNISEINFSKELAIFSEADINRLAWKDKYKVDSTINIAGSLSALRYTALEDKMRTQSLIISFQDNQVDSIFVRNHISGFATQSDQEMVYVREKGYTIRSTQHTLFSSGRSVFVQVRYLR